MCTIQQPPVLKNGAGYLWVYFTGEGTGAEAVSFALSDGNDALRWLSLNKGQPVIFSKYGEKGLRDPFILRSHDGSRFYLLATDLNVHERPGGFHTGQLSGSRYLEIFESTDLIHWSHQRHVQVADVNAGNTWAPKAIWDAEQQLYVVYWAANLYDESDPQKRTSVTYNRMMYSLTPDFITFTPPRIWVDVDRGPGKGTIDATVAKVDGRYYRFMKEEETMTIRLDTATNLLATVVGTDYAAAKEGPADQWRTLGRKIGNGLPNGEGREFTGGEGPCLFPANSGDTNGFKWFLFIDQPGYHDGPNHYIGFAGNDLADPRSWQPVSQKLRQQLPENSKGEKPRHGSIISLTPEEYQRIWQHYSQSE